MRSAINALAVAGAMAAFSPSLVRAQAEDGVPASGFYVGIGANANVVSSTQQSIYAYGKGDGFLRKGAHITYGGAKGTTNPRSATTATISPSVQLGYFHRLSGSRWLVGGKFAYDYMATTVSKHFVPVPQSGAFIGTRAGTVLPFTGHVVIRNYQITADHQLSLVPYVGYTFDRSFVYFGAGPSLTRTTVNLSNVVGFADVNNKPGTNITGAPAAYSSSRWLIGATLAVGATHFLTPSWFVELGYSFTITEPWRSTFASPFDNVNNAYGVPVRAAGTLGGQYSGALNVHRLMVSINRRF